MSSEGVLNFGRSDDEFKKMAEKSLKINPETSVLANEMKVGEYWEGAPKMEEGEQRDVVVSAILEVSQENGGMLSTDMWSDKELRREIRRRVIGRLDAGNALSDDGFRKHFGWTTENWGTVSKRVA